jgi:hypothetical protein
LPQEYLQSCQRADGQSDLPLVARSFILDRVPARMVWDGDTITLNSNLLVPLLGGDTIITGTGASDAVTVAAHTNADTFGFSLAGELNIENNSQFTTITGAQVGNQVAVGNSTGLVLSGADSLGSTLMQTSTTDSTMALFIQSLGTLTNGDTYVGFNKHERDVHCDRHAKWPDRRGCNSGYGIPAQHHIKQRAHAGLIRREAAGFCH